MTVMMGVAIVATPLVAQSAAAAKTTPQYPLDVAVTYNATMSNSVTSKSFWMQGGSVQVHGQFYRGLGVVADIAGAHVGNINSSGVGLDMVATTFGPRYTWTTKSRKYALFGQALGGEGFGFHSVFPGVSGATVSSYNLAVKAGGGLNVALTPRIALRAIEADWLRTQLPNATTNVQNNVSLGTGVVMRFR
jgi:peptidoglycan-associated lipoprotein